MKIIIDIDERDYEFIKSVRSMKNGDTFQRIAIDLFRAVHEAEVSETENERDHLISREALKRKLQYVYSCEYIGSKSKEGIVSDIIDTIDNALSITPEKALMNKLKERPQIKWIICDRDIGGIHKIECPYCGYVKGSDFGGLITLTFDRLPPFCENCGANMRGEE